MWVDWVKCCNCGIEAYVPMGEEQCPNCKMVGALAWADEERQEVEDYPRILSPVASSGNTDES